MPGVLRLLAGGDRRSTGKVDEVVRLVEKDAGLLPELVAGLTDEDEVVRMRAADALEKATATAPDLLQPHKRQLLKVAGQTSQQEVRWHMAQMLPRLRLTAVERRRAFDLMKTYLDDQSRIVQTFALQTLADFAEADASLVDEARSVIELKMKDGSPAVRARGRKLLAKLR